MSKNDLYVYPLKDKAFDILNDPPPHQNGYTVIHEQMDYWPSKMVKKPVLLEDYLATEPDVIGFVACTKKAPDFALIQTSSYNQEVAFQIVSNAQSLNIQKSAQRQALTSGILTVEDHMRDLYANGIEILTEYNGSPADPMANQHMAIAFNKPSPISKHLQASPIHQLLLESGYAHGGKVDEHLHYQKALLHNR